MSINGAPVFVNKNLTVLQACESIGVTIPHFCYHDKLSIAGNCRMCLIEESRTLKPQAACAVPFSPSIEIYTNTELVKKAREGVLEFLLANHPLDCPICDQGGECDLQDQSLVFGGDRGRFYEDKRATRDKDFGPFIKTIMTRCIHCTRCVRFISEISGTFVLGSTGRGSLMEIGLYIEEGLRTELSGNVVDLCPVGALTSKAYAFEGRPWELQSFESIDLFDSFNSNIRIDVRNTQILRVLPKINSNLNEDWISDKVRFAFDALRYQRLGTPLYNYEGFLMQCDWDTFLLKLSVLLSNKHSFVQGILGPFVDIETVLTFKNMLNTLGSSSTTYESFLSFYANIDFLANFCFNFKNSDISQADFCLCIGSNYKQEAPIFNLKLRQLFLRGVNVYSFGFHFPTTFYAKFLGSNFSTLLDIIEGRHWLSSKLRKAKKPLIILGHNMFSFKHFSVFFSLFSKIATRPCWQGLGVLSLNSGMLNSNYAGFSPDRRGPQFGIASKFKHNINCLNFFLRKSQKKKKYLKIGSIVNYFVGTNTLIDSSNILFKNIKRDFGKVFTIYQGHHSVDLLNNVHYVVPVKAPFEKNGYFINNFCDIQSTQAIFYGLNNLKNDWEIFNMICLNLKKKGFFFDNINLANFLPNLKVLNSSFDFSIKLQFFGIIFNHMTSPLVFNFYQSDIFSKSSKIMGLSSLRFDKSNVSYQI